MKILLMISSLGPGGAERVMTLLADGLVARGHDVSLLTLASRSEDFFRVDARIQRIDLGLTGHSPSALHALSANLRRLLAIRRIVVESRPDAVLAFITTINVLAILACRGLRARVVVSERVDPRGHPLEAAWSALRSFAYRRADLLVVQTREAADWFRPRMRGRTPVVTIANPVILQTPEQGAHGRVPEPFVLAAGRLVRQKGFDVLIDAFSRIAETHPALHLAIVGEGPDLQSLTDQAARLGLGSRVVFLGRTAGLSALMTRAVAFVLSSRYEGFPNVLLEALACSTPAVATDCPGGCAEILGGGLHGLLIPPENPIALAAALNRIVADGELREQLAGTGPVAAAAYALENIVSRWEYVLAGPHADAAEQLGRPMRNA